MAAVSWKSRLAAVLVAAPVVAVAAFFVWQSMVRDASEAPFFDHYRNGRYEEALADTERMDASDYRVALYRAAIYVKLERVEEAKQALAEARARGFVPPGTREEMIELHGMDPDLADDLMQALTALE